MRGYCEGDWWKCSKMIVVMVHSSEYTENHWIAYFKWVNDIVCDLYHEKTFKKLSELISELNKVAEYKINIQKSIVFHIQEKKTDRY